MSAAAARAWRSVQLLEVSGADEAVRDALPADADALLVPGYVLARCSAVDAQRLSGHPLVARVLPGAVSHAEVVAIRRALAQTAPPALPRLRRGTDVTVTAGPAAGLQGVVERQAGDVVRVRLELHSGSREVDCARAWVTAR